MGRPGEKRDYDKEYKNYHSKPKQKENRAERNKDADKLKKDGVKTSKKVKGKLNKKKCQTEAGHTKDFKDGGTKKTPVKAECAKKNRGWRKGEKGDKGRATAAKKGSTKRKPRPTKKT